MQIQNANTKCKYKMQIQIQNANTFTFQFAWFAYLCKSCIVQTGETCSVVALGVSSLLGSCCCCLSFLLLWTFTTRLREHLNTIKRVMLWPTTCFGTGQKCLLIPDSKLLIIVLHCFKGTSKRENGKENTGWIWKEDNRLMWLEQRFTRVQFANNCSLYGKCALFQRELRRELNLERGQQVDVTGTTVGSELGTRVRLTRVQFANSSSPLLHLSALHVTNKWIKTSHPRGWITWMLPREAHVNAIRFCRCHVTLSPPKIRSVHLLEFQPPDCNDQIKGNFPHSTISPGWCWLSLTKNWELIWM